MGVDRIRVLASERRSSKEARWNDATPVGEERATIRSSGINLANRIWLRESSSFVLHLVR